MFSIMNNLYIQAQYIKVLIDDQVIPVLNFDLGIFSVYGHGLCLKTCSDQYHVLPHQ